VETFTTFEPPAQASPFTASAHVGAAPSLARGAYSALNTIARSPARRSAWGHPSIAAEAARASASGGQLVARWSRPPATATMRVPSFWTKSASFTPAT
jgi:hypothetical protein